MREFMRSLYQKALRALGLFERRCAWCKKFQGWKYAGRAAQVSVHGHTTHGICEPCRIKFEADDDLARVQLQEQQRRHKIRYQLPWRSTLRRRTGGWSGAVALRGRVSH